MIRRKVSRSGTTQSVTGPPRFLPAGSAAPAELAAILRARIERNEFPPRQPLPSESQLIGEYGVSRGSVRHALQVLADEGLTVTIQGRGTYVLPLEDN